ncbi:MAG TPA: glutamate 5-kinase [Myxococcota bacterium]|nr:glutamate 5-kinase [Myxococcota bacterium]
MKRAELARARRVVVKLGTSLLTPARAGVETRRFHAVARQVAAEMRAGREVVIVASGAVGLGSLRLGLAKRPSAIPAKQAAAAVGQIDLCRRFERAFAREKLVVGQILLDHAGFADRERFLNARRTLAQLLADRVVPIINENDSVATEELRFGDNDQLAAQVVNTCGADLLVLLTDIDGLRDGDPRAGRARRIAEVDEVTPRVLALAGDDSTALGTGGMRSKLLAARAASRFGVSTVIADGRKRDVLRRILAGDDVGTWVRPAEAQLSSRKHWIAFTLKPRGALSLDAGAVRALRERRASLLPAGVTEVSGRFGVGDLVACLTPEGDEVARGLVSYDAREIERIKRRKTGEIHEVLGYSNGDEVIHRDNLIVF